MSMQKGNKRSRESQARYSDPPTSGDNESVNTTENIAHNSDISGYPISDNGGQRILFRDFIKDCIVTWEQYLLGVKSGTLKVYERLAHDSSSYSEALDVFQRLDTKLKNLVCLGEKVLLLIERFSNLGESAFMGFEKIQSEARLVDSYWEVYKNALQHPDNLTSRIGGIFEQWIDGLLSAMMNWLRVPRVAPDSQRLDELLPPITTNGLHFANRDDATKKLLTIHLKHMIRRLTHSGGYNKIFPLLDSLYGMGKTTFSIKYLALVGRWVREIESQFVHLDDAERKLHVAKRARSILGYDLSRLQDVANLLHELRQARTLHIEFTQGGLGSLDTTQQEQKLIEMIHDAAWVQWGAWYKNDQVSCLKQCLDQIGIPVFIIFDEIGSAFQSEIANQREAFNKFVDCIGTGLLSQSQLYYILSGRADFLWEVGLNPELGNSLNSNSSIMVRSQSPGIYERINLNPIRADHIKTILQCTILRDGQRTIEQELMAKLENADLDNFCKQLYDVTGGHPRSLLICVSNEDPQAPLPDTEMGILLADVKRSVQSYPLTIRKLLNDSRRGEVDLTEVVHLPGGKSISREFFATRIHCGIGNNLKSSRLMIMPPILHYLETYFQPFMNYLIDLGSRIKPALAIDKIIDRRDRSLDKSRVFERMLVEWFLSIAHNSNTTWAEKLDNLWPLNSFIGPTVWHLDGAKLEEGELILQEDKESQKEGTISISKLANKIANYLNTGEIHLYFPAPKSCSPDIIIIPPVTSQKFLIGVQAKCYCQSSNPTNGRNVLEEARKFYNILQETRRVSSVRGCFIMCTTSSFSKKDFRDLHQGEPSMIWTPQKDEFEDFEIVIINLSTVEFRTTFFGLGIPGHHGTHTEIDPAIADARKRISEIVEAVIDLRT